MVCPGAKYPRWIVIVSNREKSQARIQWRWAKCLNDSSLFQRESRRYVNANLQGMSPLKIGVKGDIPPSSFNSLYLAFESYVRIMQINSKSG